MSSLQNGRESGFKESLRFFQNQVNQADVPLSTRKSNGIIKSHGSSDDTKTKIGNSAPSVDNILSNVKTICSNRNAKHSKYSAPLNIKDSKDQSKKGSVVYQSSVNGISRESEGVTRSEQIISKVIKTTSEHSVKPSLLSNFNPSLEFDDTSKCNNSTNFLSDSIQKKTSKETPVLPPETNASQNEPVTHSKTLPKRSNLNDGTQILNSEEKTDSKNLTNNRTFGQCKEKLASQKDSPKSSPVRNIQIQLSGAPNRKTDSFTIVEVGKKEDTSESFESDYDSQDFVVHKATFPEDYLEAMSEDNYSSVNEEYEVELPHDPDIPSPDYASDEEEYLVQHSDVQEYDNVEFIDNSAQYANDPRRYIYYPDDKELEVIPEEDEDDIEDNDIYNNADIYKRGSYSTDSRYNALGGECDSGLTDDQRSSCSTAEECDLEDDTDSAKGSLHDSPTMFPNVEFHKTTRSDKPIKPQKIYNGLGEREELPPRNLTSLWDPKELLEVLYRLDIPIEPSKNPTRYINKEGYLDKLPSGRKKATYWNPWKTKYINLKDGFLYCYDNNRAEKASMTLQLMGGHIDTLENKMIGVDDQKGHYLVLRCSDDDEIESWENALRSQCAEDFNNAYTSPCLRPLSTNKNVIIIDFGSCSVRAGRLMSQPSLPQLFFPTVNAKNKSSGKSIFGIDALKPSIRKECSISFPLHPSAKVTKYSIDVNILPDLLKHIFKELNVYPEDYKVQLSMPRNLSLQTKIKIARMLLDDFKVKGVNLTHQAILSLHAYNSKSGIIVDIGDRLDVIPIIEGYIVESGVTRLPYGGLRMIHHLKHSLAEKNISVVSDIESYLARYVLEQLCYVAEDYNEELQRFYTTPDDFEMSISTSHFFNNDCFIDEIILDMGRFHVPEGLFTPEKWGLDNPGLHKLVHHAIQECGVDLRKEMTKSIYVSGGLTLLPGFVERLEKEIDKLTPNTPKVHASNYRYHMSYIGACQIALEEKFEDVCITKHMWRKEGNTCVKKWHI